MKPFEGPLPSERESSSVLSLTENFYGPLKSLKRVIPSPIVTKPEARRWKLETCDLNRILFIGRFDRHKGADTLLRAFATLAPTVPNLKLDFVGNDVGLILQDGRRVHLAEYIKRIAPTALSNRIKFHGPLSRSEIEKLRTTAYLTIVASRYETFGNTVIEAMAAGCPLIATNVGGISEAVVNNVNGLVVPPDDIDQLSAAVMKLYSGSAFGNSARWAGRARL